MSVGVVEDLELCDKISNTHKTNPVVLWQVEKEKNKESQPFTSLSDIAGSDSKEILENILSILPNPESLNEEQFKVRKLFFTNYDVM